MTEQRNNGFSISFRKDDGVVEHNNRHFVAKNVDRARIADNITYVSVNLRDFYNSVFGQALSEYNARKAHPYQRIPDYYEHIRKSKQEKLYEEIVVQFGDMHDCGVGSENWETAKTMLDEYMRDFEKRNPNLKVFNAVMHLDEATPHLHIDFVPVVHSPNRGLSTRVSMKGALREQGFSSANRFENEWVAWSESERGFMEEILRRHGLFREDKNVHREHLSVDDYKKKAQTVQEIKTLNAHINELKKKSHDSYSHDEIELIKNQNDFLRSELTKRDERISALSRQVNAPFIPFEIYSEDKLQYVSDGLTRAKIPFVEDSRMLHIPDYALKTANAIAAHYQPTNVGTIREQIALDIDRLIYNSTDVEDLLKKLQERGYELKRGKYVAVKAPFAERFVRLKSLGDEYLPKQLEKRISIKDNYPNSVRQAMSRQNDIERKISVTILQTTTAIREFRVVPRKTIPKRTYTYSNDESINLLVMQLQTIGEFGFSSRDGIVAKAAELKNSVDSLTEEIKVLTEEQPTLKSEIAQIRYYLENYRNRRNLDAMAQVKLAAAREIVEKHGVTSEEDLLDLEKRLSAIPSRIQTAKSKLANEQTRLKRVNKLAEVYEKVVEGNYIDNLIREQKEQERRREDELIRKKS